jgi:hypothetical protein
VAFAHVDDAVSARGIEPEDHSSTRLDATKRRAAPRARRRQVRLADDAFQLVLCKGSLDPRDEIAAIRFVVRMLELAATALGKVPTRRILVMRSRSNRTVVEKRVAWHSECDVAAALSDPVSTGGYSNDQFMHVPPRPSEAQLPSSSLASASA